MKKQTKPVTNCSGTSLWGKRATGGHFEDYISDPNNVPYLPKGMKWEPVWNAFKKEGMSL